MATNISVDEKVANRRNANQNQALRKLVPHYHVDAH